MSSSSGDVRDQRDGRQELHHRERGAAHTAHPQDAAREQQEEREEHGPQRPAARGAAVVVGHQEQGARSFALAPGDDVLRRAPSEQPPSGRSDAGEVEEGEHRGEQDQPRAELGARYREHAADHRDDRVDRVADRPSRPHGERLDHNLPPEPPRAARQGAEPPAARHPTQAAAAQRRRRAPQPRRRGRSDFPHAPAGPSSTWSGRSMPTPSQARTALRLGTDELVEPCNGGPRRHRDVPRVHDAPLDSEHIARVAEDSPDVVGSVREVVTRILVGLRPVPDRCSYTGSRRSGSVRAGSSLGMASTDSLLPIRQTE